MKAVRAAWWIWALLPLIIVSALLLSGVASAETFSFTNASGDWVQLTAEPCAKASGWLKLHKASMRWKGKMYEACWFSTGQQVVVLDEAGDASVFSVAIFQKDKAL